MKISSIITEYNPFHYGHKFHLESCKKDTNSDGVICIMSGNFVQRGIPAITDKWSRAQMALEQGVDLVIELPTLFSVSSAEFFAYGAISILDSLKIVDNVYFGAESKDIKSIQLIAEILFNEPKEFKILLKENLNLGLAFPVARANALCSYILTYINSANITIDELTEILNNSNNILAIEYCKNLLKLNSTIKPISLKRLGSSYNDITPSNKSFSSATAIRHLMYSQQSLQNIKELLPKSSYNILNSQKSLPDINKMFEFIKYMLLSNPELIKNIPDASEGLDNKILKELNFATDYSDLISRCKSKRYTHTRISRILCQVYLSITSDFKPLYNSIPSYIRILGLNKTGAKIIKEIKSNSNIEIITKVPKNNSNPLLALDLKASDLYSLINTNIPLSSDFLKSPIIK
ncbi:MAG: nucleotidyltransferase [Sarcina sp.]